MNRLWAFIAGAAVLGAAILVALYLRARGRSQEAAVILADAAEKSAKAKIEESQSKLEELHKNADKNAEAIKVIEAELEQKREALDAKFVRQGLSAEEIADRFRRLRL